MTNIKYQNYSHYKLPITSNPLEYGKLLDQTNNKFIIQLTTRNIAVINHTENENFVRIFKNGDLALEFRDKIINDRSFARYIHDTKFVFENDRLISTQILNASGLITIFNDITPLLLIFILITYLDFTSLNYAMSLIPASIKLNSTKRNIIKLRKVASKYNWKDLVFNINNKVFTKILFESKFNSFWNEIENKFTNENHMFILFKIKYVNGQTLSIGKVQRVNNLDKNWYSEFILDYIELKNNYYKETRIEGLIFSYGFKIGKIKNKDVINPNIQSQNYNNYLIPISMNHLDYGIVVNWFIENGIGYILHNNLGQTIKFIKFDSYNEIEIIKLGKVLIKFKDELISENKFIRIIDHKKYYFENGEQFLITEELKTKFISKTRKIKFLTNKFITLDIETYIIDGLLIPYLICFYDGKNFYSFYLSDYNSVEEMMIDCLKSILIRKYNGYKIYAHNLSKFDIIFLMKYLVKLGNIKPIIHNGKFILIKLNYGENKQYQVEFRDSLLMLLASLNQLCKSFKIKNPKSIFPHLFVNENNLNYIGDVPSIKFFINKIELNDYNNYKSRFKENWNLKNEAIKYCKIDCISLYQILFKFNNMIFKLFSKNIHHFPTLSSLAFDIFRSNFMKENTIPQLSGKIDNDIRSGYTGGAVDMYIPEGENINCYDVNSLYPSQMHSQLMPIGNPTYFKGNILNIKENAFGFFYCKITAPDNIQHPIIQTKVKIHGVNKTISPIGTWEDMLFSEEILNAEKYGYKFEVLWGYTFNSEIIFKDYVDFLYNLRLNYPKSDPMNFIAKILLNSLYGRFGMRDDFDSINVIHKDFYPDFENKFIDQITDKIELDSHVIVFYKSFDDKDEHNKSVSIAAAITAYARIHMSQFKNNPKINLYYSDTDSIFTDSEIDESFIDSRILGKLKLEYICKRAIFLAPKVYCLETVSQSTLTPQTFNFTQEQLISIKIIVIKKFNLYLIFNCFIK
jgi:DNA polymerase type B, organellar and viral